MWSILARAIIRAYPRSWRERYAAELLALVESAPPCARDVVDLVRGCVSEWTCEPALQEAVVLVAATTLVAMPAIWYSESIHVDEWQGNRTRWMVLLQSAFMWMQPFAFFLVKTPSGKLGPSAVWWRLRFPARRLPAFVSWCFRIGLLFGAVPYFEYIRFHLAPGWPVWLFLIGSPAHLFVLLDRYAKRPWFPHPGRIEPPRPATSA